MDFVERFAARVADPALSLGCHARNTLLRELESCQDLCESLALYELPHALFLRVDELCAAATWLARAQGDEAGEGDLNQAAEALVDAALDNARALWPDPAHRQRVAAVRLTLPDEPGYSVRERELMPGPMMAAPPRLEDPAYRLWTALLDDQIGAGGAPELTSEILVEWGIPVHFVFEAAAFRAAEDEDQPLVDLQALCGNLAVGKDGDGALWLEASAESFWRAKLDGVMIDDWDSMDDGSQRLMLTAGRWELNDEENQGQTLVTLIISPM
jgi:hypothetical protein